MFRTATHVAVTLSAATLLLLSACEAPQSNGGQTNGQSARSTNDEHAVRELITLQLVTSSLPRHIAAYQRDCGVLPASLADLHTQPRSPELARKWQGPYTTDKAGVDGWGNPLRYTCPGEQGPGSYILRSAGADGEFDTADDIVYKHA